MSIFLNILANLHQFSKVSFAMGEVHIRALHFPVRRRGTGMLDLLISFTLLLTVISASTPLIVRHGRMLKAQREYRLALEEVTNQLDRLTALPFDDLPQAVKQLSPSMFIAERLAHPQLTGELKPAQFGTRITLRLSWHGADHIEAPIALAAWAFPKRSQPAKATAEELQP
jgi:hypothetical protein